MLIGLWWLGGTDRYAWYVDAYGHLAPSDQPLVVLSAPETGFYDFNDTERRVDPGDHAVLDSTGAPVGTQSEAARYRVMDVHSAAMRAQKGAPLAILSTESAEASPFIWVLFADDDRHRLDYGDRVQLHFHNEDPRIANYRPGSSSSGRCKPEGGTVRKLGPRVESPIYGVPMRAIGIRPDAVRCTVVVQLSASDQKLSRPVPIGTPVSAEWRRRRFVSPLEIMSDVWWSLTSWL